jgi:hypothetical protein
MPQQLPFFRRIAGLPVLTATPAIVPADTVGAPAGAVTAVERQVDALRAAMLRPTHAALAPLLADSLSYGHSNGRVESKDEFIELLLSGKSVFVTLDLTEQTVDVSGTCAVVRHTLTADTNDGGNPGHVKLKILLVWHNENGRWTLLARQAVRLP